MKKVLVVFGTRPETIKLAPVIKALEQDDFELKVLHTGQHRDLIEPMLALFDIRPDFNFEIMKENQDLFDLTESLISKFRDILAVEKPDYVVVQGDTSSAFVAALSAFYLKIPVLHVEAGLRSNNLYYPFPEEGNRSLISRIASRHFAPTELNKKNLLKEGISENQIHITGNTVVDALELIRKSEPFAESKPDILSKLHPENKLVVLTAHRRENHGQPFLNILQAVKEILQNNENLEIVFPAHPSPAIQDAILESGIQNKRLHITEPIGYLPFLHILIKADLILTDSGGIQEEAATLGKPILVLRNETERQELIESGLGILVGTDKERIVEKTEYYLNIKSRLDPQNLYGDGTAAKKICNIIKGLK